MEKLSPAESKTKPSELRQIETLASLKMERGRWLETRERMRRSGAKHAWNARLGEVEYLAPDSDINQDWHRTDGRMNLLLGELSALASGVDFAETPSGLAIPVAVSHAGVGVEVPVDYSRFQPGEYDGA